MNDRTRQPFSLNIPGAATEENRNPVDEQATREILTGYTEGNEPIAVAPTGQIESANSPVLQNMSDRDKEKIGILAEQIRSF